MLELGGMQSTFSLQFFPGLVCLGMVALDRVLFIGYIEIKYVLMLN